MKTRSIIHSVLFATITTLLFMNCSGNKKEQAEESSSEQASSKAKDNTSEPQFQVDASFQEQLANVFTSYIKLKDAFVSSDPGKVKTEAQATSETLSRVDMKLLTGAAHNDWMSYLSPLQSSLTEMTASSDIEAQRKSFSTLSDNLYKSIKAFGLGGKEAFYDYCPMAFNNAGGYWLSDQQQIRNPYFGDEMLTCGSVKEKLK
jgi:hypothetical protein